MIVAIDPGNTESGVVILGDGYNPRFIGILPNAEVVITMGRVLDGVRAEVVIEMIGHYGSGMPAGKDVFDTCVWIGRFIEAFTTMGLVVQTLPRATVKLNLCHSKTAKDQNVIQALVDRFDRSHGKYGKGTKRNLGFFFGFKEDIWQAFALGTTYVDMKRSGTL